jgi:cytoskeletal protein RodZ
VTDEKEGTGGKPEQTGDQPEQTELGGEETVGEMLLGAREKKGLPLEVVSQDTKIPVSTLQYLETDNFEAIPAKVYATGFLKIYAQILGLDPAQVINKYEVQTGQTHRSRGDLWEIEEEVVEEKLGSTHLLRRFVIPAILVAAAIIILLRVFGGEEEGAGPQTAVPGSEEDSGERPDRPGDIAAERHDDSEIPGGSEGGAAAGVTALEEPVTVRQEEKKVAEPSTTGEMSLRIVAEERIWFDLIIYTKTASGIDTLETDFILEPGESRTFTSNEHFFIRKIGKTEGFTIELDGRPYEVPIVEGRLPRDITIPRDR